MNLDQELIIQIAKLYFGTLPGKLATLFAAGKISILSTPFWVPIIYKAFEIATEEQISVDMSDVSAYGTD